MDCSSVGKVLQACTYMQARTKFILNTKNLVSLVCQPVLFSKRYNPFLSVRVLCSCCSFLLLHPLLLPLLFVTIVLIIGSDSKSESDDDSDLLQLLLEEAEEEEEQEQELLTAMLSSIPLIFDKREESHFRRRLDWSTHVSEFNCEGPNAFYKLYRMH